MHQQMHGITNEPVSWQPHPGRRGVGEEQVRTALYLNRGGKPAVAMIVLSRHGHNWPGGTVILNHRMAGPNAQTLDATPLIWEFFQQHSLWQ